MKFPLATKVAIVVVALTFLAGLNFVVGGLTLTIGFGGTAQGG